MTSFSRELKINLAELTNDKDAMRVLLKKLDEEEIDICINGNVIPKTIQNPLHRAYRLQSIIVQYSVRLAAVEGEIRELFRRSGIEFRLEALTGCLHNFNNITLVWNIGYQTEVAFDFLFDISLFNTMPTLYKTGKFSYHGTVIDGDFLHGTQQSIDDSEILPTWFVDSLRADS